MTRTFTLVAAAAVAWTAALAVPDAVGQDRRGPNQASEEAAKWVAAAGDRFVLELVGCATTVRLTNDKKASPRGAYEKAFVITPEEAAAAVQVLADCGLWSRPDTLPEFPAGRLLYLRGPDREVRAWRLGGCAEDVSSMVIVRHLLSAAEGERKQALKDWLTHLPADKK